MMHHLHDKGYKRLFRNRTIFRQLLETFVPSHKLTKWLPPVFPIVLYNGKKRWTAPTDVADLIPQHDLIQHVTLRCQYFPIEERAFKQTDLLKVHNIVSTLFLTETHYDLDILAQKFLNLFQSESDRQAVSLFLNWFRHLSLYGRIMQADYQALEEHLYQKEEDVAMLIEEIRKEKKQIYLEGKLEGRLEGKLEGKLEVARSMLANNLPIEFIAKLTGIPVSEIERLREPPSAPGSLN